ncbi:MAG TPA: molybdate ABC transporter substrate-binding protein, partial [Planctomycetes bacterium]|nr:molybdate ABC transporter substrate-binding protein [Planctomycetota bacterium]
MGLLLPPLRLVCSAPGIGRRFLPRTPVLLLAVVLAAACGRSQDRPVLKVLAASSLRDLLGGLEGECEREIDVDLEFSFGASSTLSRRIEAGGGCDVFLSADAQSLDRVLDQLDPETRHVFLANRLALVSGPASGEEAGRIDDPADLVECVGDIAIGGPTVPAGRYARRWLQGAGLLPRLEPRFQNARSARAALTMVAGGAVPFGFVYSSDARSTATVVLLWESG